MGRFVTTKIRTEMRRLRALNTPIEEIARLTGFSYDTVWNHLDDAHMAKAKARSRRRIEAIYGDFIAREEFRAKARANYHKGKGART